MSDIKHRFTGEVLHTSQGANLQGADLRYAYLDGADLQGANLYGAYLRGANLGCADLQGANLMGADLMGANLRSANLRSANLQGASLEPIRNDVWAVLSAAPAEVPALLEVLRAGKFDGTHYEGDCACLVGTIAKVRGCMYQKIPSLVPDSNRPAERWALAIKPGDTPESSVVAGITASWIEEWIATHPDASAPPSESP